MARCPRCKAQSFQGAINCWACGVRLQRPVHRRREAAFQPSAMRYYDASAATRHHSWVDSLVLLSTVLFGLLLSYFVVTILPFGSSDAAPGSRVLTIGNPLSFLMPAPRLLDIVPLGAAVESQGIVAQVIQPHRTRTAGERLAGAGNEFLVVIAVIDNQTGQPMSYHLNDWQVRDSRGRVRAAENVRGAGWLSGGTIEPGQRVQASLAFLVPEGEPAPVISFGAAALRGVMRWDGGPPLVH